MYKHAQATSRLSVLSTLLLATTLCPMLPAQTTDKASTVAKVQEVQAKKIWRAAMRHVSVPGRGCFHAAYPSTKWEKMECIETHNSSAAQQFQSAKKPAQSPAVVTGPGLGVGNSNSFVAQAPDGQLIQAALGNFLSEYNLDSETGANVVLANGELSDGIVGTNQLTLQLNTNKAYTPACSLYTECLAYEQFIFSTDLAGGYQPSNGYGYPGAEISAWLLNFGTLGYGFGDESCPTYYHFVAPNPAGPGADCVYSAGFLLPGTATIADIKDVEVYGETNVTEVDSNGDAITGDILEVGYRGDAYIYQAVDSSFSNKIGTAWTTAEFNVLGNGGGSQAQFSPNTGLVGLLGLEYNSTDAPTCLAPLPNIGRPSDSNNLNPLECVTGGGQYPYIVFSESN